MSELVSLNIAQMREGLLRKDFSAVELTRAHLSRIEETNEALNSFLLTSGSSAMEQAEKADSQIAEQKDRTPVLTGIPVAIKDMILTDGIESRAGSKILNGFVPPYDSTVVAKLKRNGAIILGKTNQDEFGMGSSTENSAFGISRNPYDLDRVPGGSSGGSAAAVCAGQVPVALGTDTGGSIRQPSSLCGILGIKPTYGRVSRYGVTAYASSLDQVGTFGRDVSDLAEVLTAISGEDPNDSTSMKVAVPNFALELKTSAGQGLKGLRIGIPKEYFIPGLSAEIADQIRGSLKVLEQLGAEIVEVSLPHTEFALAVYYIIALAEASSNLARYDGVRYGHRTQSATELREMYAKTRAEGFGAEVRRRILLGTYVLSAGYYDAYYKKAQEVRTLLVNDFRAAFANRCDAIFAPVSPTVAWKFGEKSASPLEMYLADVFTVPINLAGLPAVALPIARSQEELPIGAQFIGPPFGESVLLRLANEFLKQKPFDMQSITAKPIKLK